MSHIVKVYTTDDKGNEQYLGAQTLDTPPVIGEVIRAMDESWIVTDVDHVRLSTEHYVAYVDDATETAEQRLQRVRDEIVRILKENDMYIYRERGGDEALYVSLDDEKGTQVALDQDCP